MRSTATDLPPAEQRYAREVRPHHPARGTGVVITVYSERRVRVAAEVAARLAAALARTAKSAHVALAIEVPLPVAVPGVTVRDLTSTSVAAFPDAVRRAREEFDIAIIAPEEGRSQRAFLAMEHADRILLPSDLTLAGIRSTQRVLQLLSSLGFPYDKCHVLVYEVPGAVPFSAADAALALKREVYFHLVNGVHADDEYDALAMKLSP